ncbi:transporter substrate-binding domain-containing protein [Bifidobacterium stellenboschense]|uniref:Periplasmic component of amino acid ABC-type transporter/signal transduction system n=1 Tax=Bifidobacterium stellenboschense TaxID=762211 RepID=A0A087DNE0_9BIFI|nr:transporter substrate-binding domain-containing protein [Bifidobacterium stellenboschense]KFI97040.1 periplasmic component of amino acid ABC-type transporter/signal transduction system [Bifidobacterium stellenboschense]
MAILNWNLKKTAAAALATLLVVGGLSGCGTSANAEESNAQTIRVGVGNAWAPYDYVDENGKAAGYEVEVLKKIDEKLPEYKFDIQPAAFDTLLVSLDAGKLDLIAHTWRLNEQREKKYNWTKQSDLRSVVRIVTSKKSKVKYNSIADFAGHSVYAAVGESTSQQMEEYNKQHPDNPIKIVYANANVTTEQRYTALAQGKVDAWYCPEPVLNDMNKNFGGGLKAVGKPLEQKNTTFFTQKGEKQTKLTNAIDGALKELRADGTLKKLGEQYLGGDFSQQLSASEEY